jgi:hypothetical protein
MGTAFSGADLSRLGYSFSVLVVSRNDPVVYTYF